ncbi:GDSL esterase/lipase At4g16230 isoform X1 [Elaeis guineensis]|uniref:GDSL esterase/lipase At4g16230 isoform X1 n=2 Tax=Elaeis guineensis var. tenera TaxID=51953 RepID=A0A6I9R6B2_ELAGV|nr:GDSL esterase/lipase At4g16230 isoform X1 [Elaeis guineensis]
MLFLSLPLVVIFLSSPMGYLSNHRYILYLLSIISCFVLRNCSINALPASFVFGDSLVDVGNNNYIVTLSKADRMPNGIDFPTHQPTGRFTNGRTIADILGQELGLKNFTPPYMAPTTVGPAVLQGVNYASGAGGILDQTGRLFGGRINLDAQIDNFANTREYIISSLGMPAALSLLRNALFSVAIGSNDIINNYLIPVVSAPERAVVSPEAFVESMISKFRMQLTRMYLLGARKIIVANVGPIGCIPYQRDTNPSTGSNCVEFPNQMAQSYNKRLKDLLLELRSSLEGALIAYANVYHIVADIIQHHTNYGFDVADSACCFVAGQFGGLVPCGPTSKVCPDRSKYVFWDPYHPSDATNMVIAQRLLDGDLNDVYPMNVRRLVSA